VDCEELNASTPGRTALQRYKVRWQNDTGVPWRGATARPLHLEASTVAVGRSPTRSPRMAARGDSEVEEWAVA